MLVQAEQGWAVLWVAARERNELSDATVRGEVVQEQGWGVLAVDEGERSEPSHSTVLG